MAWALTHHARQRILEYGISAARVLEVVLHWEQEYGGNPRRYPEHYRTRQAKDLAVVVDPDRELVITVLLRRQEPWGRQAT